MKTLNLYTVSFATISGAEHSLNVAAATKKAARQQVKDYSKTVTAVRTVERIGNVNVPVQLPAGL
jgi:hypothetical protein